MKDKKKSHRVTLKKKYSVEKKVRGHTKKLKKMIKKGTLNKRYKKKDPGIPNSFPFKAQMLEEIRKQKEKAVAEKAQKHLEQKQKRKEAARLADDDDDEMGEATEAQDDENNYAEIRKRAEQAGEQFSHTSTTDVEGGEKCIEGQQNATTGFYRSLRQVIEQSDVVVEVLDARDPPGSRNANIERQIVADGKKLILLLNKIDLVPKEVVELWSTHLRKSFPVVTFKSALTTQASRPITHAASPAHVISESELNVGSQVVGAPALIQLLKNYSRTGATNTKLAITVGIIGVPNVGKSSVINSLCKSTTSARVGGEAGITRQLQEIHLDAKIKLIDSPGVIMGVKDSSDSEMVLRGAVKISTVKAPIEVVETMLQQYTPDQIMKLFKVPFYATTTEFLGHIARARGKLAKGGVPDFVLAAQTVLTEWTSGKIRHFCLPPKDDDVAEREARDDGVIAGPRFVSQFSEPFDINALLKN